MNELISDGGDCRTGPATPGLLISLDNWVPYAYLGVQDWDHFAALEF